MTETSTELTETAMQIILKAGDGRNHTFKALRSMEARDYPAAKDELELAQSDLRDAHRMHTQVIQQDAAQGGLPVSPLFTHAQDTLMTANSEMRLVKRLEGILEDFELRLAKLEETK